MTHSPETQSKQENVARLLLDDPADNEIASPAHRLGRLPSGVLVVDKPEGMTSFAVVKRVERRLRLDKAGHCGTLDPFATGVLAICINQATRIVDQLSMQSKRYLATLHLGIETDTLDRCGQVVRRYEGHPLTADGLKKALSAYTGMITQQVPRYAAVHVNGRRLYEYARKGIEVETPSRDVCIHKLELVAFQWPRATLDVSCSKGTYIRQLGSDIGDRVGCGAHLEELRRLESGPFRIDQAIGLDELDPLMDWEQLRQRMVPMPEALVHLTRVVMEDERHLKRLRDGIIDPGWESAMRQARPHLTSPVLILDGAGELRALWWLDQQGEHGRRLRVFRN